MNGGPYFAILTGGGGGIGSAIAHAIAPQCAVLLLVGRDAPRLAATAQAVARPGLVCRTVLADLTTAEGRDAVVQAAGGFDINLLINNAGTSEFAWFADQSQASIERILDVNVLAPMLLTQRLLPQLQRRARATIVNVGSIYGYLGYPGSASYSASKFALRGFTEALRRELADSPVRVLYFAPRATRTALNDDALTALNAELGTAMDAPSKVASELVALLRRPARERLLGMPEKFYARVNQLLPGLVDSGLRKQLDTIRNFARRGKPRPARPTTTIQTSEGGPL
ncbi:MAG TPA: SDR family oxidoreductase [Burkholderiaceae bacterium]|nr:SDR family oxidoreductase [Burkholderiaceae bacterium]